MSATERRSHPGLAERAKEMTVRELRTYIERTKGSQAATERARRVMPMGVPSSFQAYDPHPIVVRRAQDGWMEDVDGNRYTDFDMGFGALFAGHCHPAVRRAIEEQLDLGTLYVTPCEGNADVAELLGELPEEEGVALIESLGVERAADVMLKERRPLIIVPRETPMSLMQLKNMVLCAEAGAIMMPAMPAFYQLPQTLDDLADFMAGKILGALGFDHDLYPKWTGRVEREGRSAP